jgi:hypothetical protein
MTPLRHIQATRATRSLGSMCDVPFRSGLAT